MIRCKIRKHTKAVAVLILCVAVCIIGSIWRRKENSVFWDMAY